MYMTTSDMTKAEKIYEFILAHVKHDKVTNAAVFATLRTLKAANKGDTYYENYLWHWQKRGDSFFDYYHLLWAIGSSLEIKNIMEIGCRTGISLCQLLSACEAPQDKNVVLFDIFDDGFISPALVRANLAYLGLPTNAKFVTGDSALTVPDYKKTMEEKFDYILVDGNHEPKAAMVDLENVYDMLEPGGILLFDDIAPDGVSLDSVWQEFKTNHKDEFLFTENYDGKGLGCGIKKG